MSARKGNFQATVAVLLPLALVIIGQFCYAQQNWRFLAWYCIAIYAFGFFYAAKYWYGQTRFADEVKACSEIITSGWLAVWFAIAGLTYIAIVLAPLAPLRFAKNLALAAGNNASDAQRAS